MAVSTIAVYTGDIPNISSDTPSQFSLNVEDLNNYITITFTPELNTTVGEINSTVTAINTSESNSQLYSWDSEAEKLSAQSFSTEDEDVFVKAYASDGDGTFTPSDTAFYSAKHYSLKASASATASQNSAIASQNSAIDSENSRLAAAAILDNFDDRYLGSKASDPTLDNDGNALTSGALYYNTTTDSMKVYDLGLTTWIDISYVPTSLTGLSDTNIGSQTQGQALTWDEATSKWIAGVTGSKNYILATNEVVQVVSNGTNQDVSILKAGNPFLVSTDNVNWDIVEGYSASITGDLWVGGMQIVGFGKRVRNSITGTAIAVVNGNIYKATSSNNIKKYDGYSQTILYEKTGLVDVVYAMCGVNGDLYTAEDNNIITIYPNGDLTATATTLDLSGIITGKIYGIAFDGTNIIIRNDSNPTTVYVMSGISSTVTNSFSLPPISTYQDGFSCINGNIVCVDYNGHTFYIMDGLSNNVLWQLPIKTLFSDDTAAYATTMAFDDINNQIIITAYVASDGVIGEYSLTEPSGAIVWGGNI